jgi:hypothetical protein
MNTEQTIIFLIWGALNLGAGWLLHGLKPR